MGRVTGRRTTRHYARNGQWKSYSVSEYESNRPEPGGNIDFGKPAEYLGYLIIASVVVGPVVYGFIKALVGFFQ